MIINKTTENNLILVKNLSFYRNDKAILYDINFSLSPKQILIISGGNGSGKTTLLKLCASLYKNYKGFINISQSVEYLGHANALYPELSIIDNLGLFYNKNILLELKPVIYNLSAKLNIQDGLNKLVKKLSCGQKRKAALLRFFISKSPIWIIDEPLANLDQDSKLIVWEIFKQHINKGGCILMSSHGEEIAEPTARRYNIDA